MIFRSRWHCSRTWKAISSALKKGSSSLTLLPLLLPSRSASSSLPRSELVVIAAPYLPSISLLVRLELNCSSCASTDSRVSDSTKLVWV